MESMLLDSQEYQEPHQMLGLLSETSLLEWIRKIEITLRKYRKDVFSNSQGIKIKNPK